jgi:hypothetical protein
VVWQVANSVASAASVVRVFQALVMEAVAGLDTAPVWQARGDWYVYTVLGALPWGGNELARVSTHTPTLAMAAGGCRAHRIAPASQSPRWLAGQHRPLRRSVDSSLRRWGGYGPLGRPGPGCVGVGRGAGSTALSMEAGQTRKRGRIASQLELSGMVAPNNGIRSDHWVVGLELTEWQYHSDLWLSKSPRQGTS